MDFLLSKPYKECECKQDASFEPLTALMVQRDGS